MLLEERVAQPTTETEASELARELYGLDVTAKTLPGEYDDNFHLTLPRSNPRTTQEESAAAGIVLKVMHPARERSVIDMQCRALHHLADRAPQLALPRGRLNRTSATY